MSRRRSAYADFLRRLGAADSENAKHVARMEGKRSAMMEIAAAMLKGLEPDEPVVMKRAVYDVLWAIDMETGHLEPPPSDPPFLMGHPVVFA